jgi:hypothetical protein
MNILHLHEIEQLAFELAAVERDCNARYHMSVMPWAKSRGGMPLGSWAAWQRGWTRKLILLGGLPGTRRVP